MKRKRNKNTYMYLLIAAIIGISVYKLFIEKKENSYIEPAAYFPEAEFAPTTAAFETSEYGLDNTPNYNIYEA